MTSVRSKLLLLFGCAGLLIAAKPRSPFDRFDHEMHTPLFEGVGVACETCHADSESYGKLAKLNRIGCHTCHNNPQAPIPATSTCTLCHGKGGAMPGNHRVDWLAKHQAIAKQRPQQCADCHADIMFCVTCHARRDTVQQTMHSRNFRFYHSIEARANPRRCDACHTVTYCRDCHAGRGDSGR
ncbi:MAG: hypothetical protein HY543_03720 [Deltaproteobacteria bacterium]|nr:hypothetical protein [Deltaproteobacteria bacterium]